MTTYDRRDFLKSLGLGCISVSFSSLFSTGCNVLKKDHPNIVYIIADDLGYGDLSCLNEESELQTQNIDQLASNGMVFTDAHSGSAVCTPTRYGVLTGRYSWRTRLKQGVLWGYSQSLISPNRMTVASFLKDHDYNTACIGKWHLGLDWQLKNGEPPEDNPQETGENVDLSKPIKYGPTALGFDYFYGIPASLDMPPYVYIENDKVTALPDRTTQNEGKKFWREGPTGSNFKHIEVLPTLTQKTVEYINKQKSGNPFFIYFPLPAPHTPILPTEQFQGKSGTNEYGDFVLQVDWTVGQIIKALKDKGLEENTLVIFTSDNGCSPMANFEELEKYGHDPSYHFRGHKADIFEGGHRIPFIAKWPKSIKSKSECNETICLTDLLATCAEILKSDLPDNAGEDSVSMLPALLGKFSKPLREATVHHSVNGSFSIRQGKWKLELCPGSGGWSYPRPGRDDMSELPPFQLYDLEKDISETNNVYDEHPDIVKNLAAVLAKYIYLGRSTPGEPQENDQMEDWPQLDWMDTLQIKVIR